MKPKKTFIYLWKAFTKALILCYFDLECHIRIMTNVLGYAIGGVLSQMTLDQLFFDHMTHKNYSDFLKSEISQWQLVTFFSKKMILAEM